MPPRTSSIALRRRPDVAEPKSRRDASRTIPPSSASRAARAPALDGLRGVAILAVVAFHVAVMATRDAAWAGERMPPAALWPLFAGKLGVDVFFVLSGFLVLGSWRQLRARHDGSSTRAAVAFAGRRARRIIPPYWFSLLILVPLRAPEWLGTAEGWRNILMFASTNQFLDTGLPHRVNVVTWSLTTEVHFYVLVPLLALLIARTGWRSFVLGLVAIAVGWRLAVGGTGNEAEWILGRVDQFAAGMAAASIVAGRHDRTRALVRGLRSRTAGIVLALAALAVAVPLGALQLVPKPLVYRSVFHSLFGLVLAAFLVRLATRERGSRLEHPWLRAAGLVSYSLYLWHWALMMEATARWGPSGIVLAAALAATAVITVVSYVLFERPLTHGGAAGDRASEVTARAAA